MKQKILELRAQNKSYREIEKILGCSKSVISYHLNSNVKKSKNNRQNKNRYFLRKKYKMHLGGKCSICGYHKCLNALHFHHKNPSEKNFLISNAIWGKDNLSESEIMNEINKCILVCANCHAELHAKYDFNEQS
jgi:5-methylcytosine-specific restriction endonuclease McrA